MRRLILCLFMLPLAMTTASPADASGLDVRLGAFFPRAQSTLFQDGYELYVPLSQPPDGALDWSSEWIGFAGGVEYNFVPARNLEIGFHVDGYARTVDTYYRDFVRPDGSDIFQTLRYQVVPFGVTFRLIPTSKRTRVAPYIGGGVDLFYYKYEEWGDFVDFLDPDLPVINDYFVDSGVTFGFHAAGGIRFYLNRDFAIVGEGRYQWAETDMGGDFSPTEPGLINRIDLSGASAYVGIHVRF